MPSWPRSSPSSRRAAALALALGLVAPVASANGRMPGATALTIGAAGPERAVVRATYGVVSTRDGGRSWKWICEQAIGISGEADPPLAVTGDGSFILVNPRGGLLLSRDEGCTWSPGPAFLEGKKTVDLASDPSAPSRAVALASTVDTIDDQGLVAYANVVGETHDGGASWSPLGALPSDFVAETLEIAPSDPARIYVSGTANDNPLLGVILRTENGGATWNRFTLPLPQGSGSVFISGIDPRDPARLWIRVPARGDTFGFFPASLQVSGDGGEHFTVVARTERAMFGFALSPDGTQLAYGGPFDGLYVGPSTGDSFTKVSALGVRCLKWRANGLYACASQPGDAFTLGLSPAADGVFEALYDARTTCPEACPAAGSFAAACESTWGVIGPGIGAPASCPVPWSVADAGAKGPSDAAAGGSASAVPDAATATGGAASSTGGAPSVIDASTGETTDASPERAPARSTDCSCQLGEKRQPMWPEVGVLGALGFLSRLRRRRPA